VSNLLIGLLGALLSTNQAQAAAQVVQENTALPLPAAVRQAATNDPVAVEFQQLLEADETTLEEAEKMIQQSIAFEAQGAGERAEELAERVDARFAQMRLKYEDFLRRHTNHVEAFLAYGSFLGETGREEESVKYFERARELDPKNPVSWNNLANYYGHRGPVKKAFEYYEKAISLKTNEPTYYQNLATTTYLFRKDAKEHYGITEQEVFDKAVKLYKQSIALDPKNFLRLADFAQTYYGIRPLRTNDALAAWNDALAVASTESERQGVYVHLARVCGLAGLYEQGQEHLKKVTLPEHAETKARVERTLARKSAASKDDSEQSADPGADLAPTQPQVETKTISKPAAGN